MGIVFQMMRKTKQFIKVAQKYFVSSAQYNAMDIFLLCRSNYGTMEKGYIYMKQNTQSMPEQLFPFYKDKICYYFLYFCSFLKGLNVDNILHLSLRLDNMHSMIKIYFL